MADAPNGGVMELYPGTFDARSTWSFEAIFGEIRRGVERHVFGFETPDAPIPTWDVIDLLSGHKTYIRTRSTANPVPIDVQLPSTMWVGEKMRLLLSDMATGAETQYVVDRISRRARHWLITAKFSDRYTLFINPYAPRGLSIHSCATADRLFESIDYEYFMCLICVQRRIFTPPSAAFGDVCVDVYDAAQYALLRADFEPAVQPEYTHVLRVRVGLRVRVVGIDGAAAGELGGVGSRCVDISDVSFARYLVPKLYDQ